MEELSKKIEVLFEQVKAFSFANPHWIYLIIGVISLVFFIGILKNKKWAIDPSNGNQRFFYNLFGHTAFRVVAAGVALLGTIAGFGMFALYLFGYINA